MSSNLTFTLQSSKGRTATSSQNARKRVSGSAWRQGRGKNRSRKEKRQKQEHAIVKTRTLTSMFITAVLRVPVKIDHIRIYLSMYSRQTVRYDKNPESTVHVAKILLAIQQPVIPMSDVQKTLTS
jgi:hypothetical protein